MSTPPGFHHQSAARIEEKTPVNAQPTLAPAASCSDQPWASNASDNDKKIESTVIAATRQVVRTAIRLPALRRATLLSLRARRRSDRCTVRSPERFPVG